MVKAGGFGNPRLGVPQNLAEKAGIRNGTFVGVMVIGPCVVMYPVSHVTEDGMPEEMARAFERAIATWEKKKA